VREITYKGEVLARIGNIKESINGVQFFSAPQDILQYGICTHKAHTVLQAHLHKIRARVSWHKTYEVFYIIKGVIACDFYNESKKVVQSEIVHEGDWVALHEGGHGFRVLEDAQFIEVKNGQYINDGMDKERF